MLCLKISATWTASLHARPEAFKLTTSNFFSNNNPAVYVMYLEIDLLLLLILTSFSGVFCAFCLIFSYLSLGKVFAPDILFYEMICLFR
jgi:hypothetical protein